MPDNDGPLVIFKSTMYYFAKERSGRKPNTVRLVDAYDEELGAVLAALENGKPASIEIVQAGVSNGPHFFRRLTDISVCGDLLGKEAWVLSWQHEDGEGTYRDPDEEDA